MPKVLFFLYYVVIYYWEELFNIMWIDSFNNSNMS